MRKSAVQISLWDIYNGVSEAIEQHKPQLIRLLEEHIDFDRLIPVSFKLAFYRHMGRKHIYHLESFIRAFVIQKLLGIPTDTLLISLLRLCAELRDFCGFDKVPDASQLTRFRDQYRPFLAQMFEDLVKKDGFLEHAGFVDNYYGTPRAFVEENRKAGRDVLLEIEVQGALQVKKQRPDALLVFLTPQSGQELERRLRGRGTETDEVIRSRMKRAGEESKLMSSYDYILVNDDVDRAVEELHGLIRSQHLAASRNSGLIERISRELAVYQ